MVKQVKKLFTGLGDVARDIILHKVDNRHTIFENAFDVTAFDVEDRSITVNRNQKMYCIELTEFGNLENNYYKFTETVMQFGYEDSARLYLFYTKNKMVVNEIKDDFCTKQNIYLFSPLKDMLQTIANHYQTELKKPKEIITAMYDIGLINSYYNVRSNFDVKPLFDIDEIPLDEMGFTFKKVFAEGVYQSISENQIGGKKYKTYQLKGLNSFYGEKQPDILSMFSAKWTGYICLTIDFNVNHVQSKIKHWRREAQKFEKDPEIKFAYRELDDNIIKAESSKYLIVNGFAVIDNESVIPTLSTSLNMNFMPKTIFSKDIVYKTPIRERDLDFDFLMRTDDVKKYFTSVHKRANLTAKKARDIYGKDLAQNYVSYSFSETNSPHWAIVAPTRSGKTFTIQAMITQLLGIKIGSEFGRVIIEYIKNLGTNKVVHFDTGYSALKLAKLLKEVAPDQVLIFEDDMNSLRFSLTDVRYYENTRKVDEADITFSLSIMDMILELNGSNPLFAEEKAEVRTAYDKVFSENEYEGMSFKGLRSVGGYEQILDEYYALYPHTDELDRIKNITDPKFKFLTKPLMSDIINYMKLKSENNMVESLTKTVLLNALQKLRVIDKLDIFKYYSKGEIENCDYFYMELETIKSLGDKTFIPIFWFIYQKLYKRDVANAQRIKNANKVPPKIQYIIEEAHNFFKYKSFEEMFEIISRESARYGIHQGFITQYGTDIPQNILGNIGTRIIMPSDKHDEQIEELKHFWSVSDDPTSQKYVDFFQDKAVRYYAFAKYGKGLMTLNVPITKEEEWLFNSDATVVKF